MRAKVMPLSNPDPWDQTPLVALKLSGLGPKTKEKLIASGIKTAGDLACFLPREYLDFSQCPSIPEAPLDTHLQIRGRILQTKSSITFNKRLPVFEILLDDGAGSLRVVWYNQKYLERTLLKGLEIAVFGKIKFERLGRTMDNPKFEILDGAPQQPGHVDPVYREVSGLKSKTIQAIILNLVATIPEEEPLPQTVVAKHGLMPQKQALLTLHQPPDAEAVIAIKERKHPALRRMIYQEFYFFQLRLGAIVAKSQRRDHPKVPHHRPSGDAFKNALAFRLTGDQDRVLQELFTLMDGGNRLLHLIQGDVGCGKTVVGLAVAHQFAQAGFQSALLCPTSVLADQHFRTAHPLFLKLGKQAALLSGSMPNAEQRQVRARLAAGEIDLVIGTHRLFQDDVHFANLGLVMVDEQHRFGVAQRRRLLKKGQAPHYLAFSATPIPRSLAMTLYGEFNILQIREKPAGRQKVRTILKKAENRDEVIAFARHRIEKGESVFWVFPLIESEDEEKQEKSAVSMFEHFRDQAFRPWSVGMVHGRLDKQELDEEMLRFKRGEHQVLVATTVIEVGVDVPEATIMVVEGCNHFGLSQLHQLRGRVGRGGKEAFCFMLIQEPFAPNAVRRLRVLEKTDDGFLIAEEDLKARGSGEILGTRQSGGANFTIGDPWRDASLMGLAYQDARN